MSKQIWSNLSLEEAILIQNELTPKIQLFGCNAEKVKTIAGIDLAYWKTGTKEYAVCCIVVLEKDSKCIIESKYSFGEVNVPYIPGCLAFRELPLILDTIQKLDSNSDLYMFDGNGYLHPRHMGIATHASFFLNRPTIGVAKNYYKIKDVEYSMPPNEKFVYTDIMVDGEIYGRVLRTMKDVRPIFLSVGNYIDLDSATKLVCELANNESHIPLPTRLADIETHKMRKELQMINR